MTDLTREEVAVELKRKDVFKFGEYNWASGVTAPFKTDFETIRQYPALRNSVELIYCEMLKRVDFDAIAGVPMGALELARRIAYRERAPIVDLSNNSRSSASGTVAVIEDVVTTGGSAIKKAVNPLRMRGYQVADVFAFIDYELGAPEIVKADCNLHSAIGVTAMLGAWQHANEITSEEMDVINSFLDELRLDQQQKVII